MKNNYYTKLRDLDRKWDWGDYWGQKAKKFMKKRSHKRSRLQLKKDQQECLKEVV